MPTRSPCRSAVGCLHLAPAPGPLRCKSPAVHQQSQHGKPPHPPPDPSCPGRPRTCWTLLTFPASISGERQSATQHTQSRARCCTQPDLDHPLSILHRRSRQLRCLHNRLGMQLPSLLDDLPGAPAPEQPAHLAAVCTSALTRRRLKDRELISSSGQGVPQPIR